MDHTDFFIWKHRQHSWDRWKNDNLQTLNKRTTHCFWLLRMVSAISSFVLLLNILYYLSKYLYCSRRINLHCLVVFQIFGEHWYFSVSFNTILLLGVCTVKLLVLQPKERSINHKRTITRENSSAVECPYGLGNRDVILLFLQLQIRLSVAK